MIAGPFQDHVPVKRDHCPGCMLMTRKERWPTFEKHQKHKHIGNSPVVSAIFCSIEIAVRRVNTWQFGGYIQRVQRACGRCRGQGVQAGCRERPLSQSIRFGGCAKGDHSAPQGLRTKSRITRCNYIVKISLTMGLLGILTTSPYFDLSP